MRFATWNCGSGGLERWHQIEQHGVDVAVLCEARLAAPDPSLLGEPVSWVSNGTKNKAVAVVSGQPLVTIENRTPELHWCVGAQVDGGPTVLAIYSNPEQTGPVPKGKEVAACLRGWADDIARGDVIVAGDFNIGYALDGPTRDPCIAESQALWEELGLVSAYHAYFDEPMTAPTRATYYWTYNDQHRWHIDHVLIPRTRLATLRSVTVGTFVDYCHPSVDRRTDHVPVIVDIDW